MRIALDLSRLTGHRPAPTARRRLAGADPPPATAQRRPATAIRRLCTAVLVIASTLAACSDTTGPEEGGEAIDVVFEPTIIGLGEERERTISLVNRGDRAVGPIQLQPTPVTTAAGAAVAESELQVTPQEIPTLNPGSSRAVTVSVVFNSAPQPGTFNVSVAARSEGTALGMLSVSFEVPESSPPPSADVLAITAGPPAPRQGDVVEYEAEVRDSLGDVLPDAVVAWTVSPASSGLITAEGRFVGYAVGPARIVARLAGLADTLDITVEPRGLQGGFSVVGQGTVATRFTSDLWVHDDHAYTGSWNCRDGACGDRLYVWDVSSPASPIRTDSVLVDARVVNDVKIRADGAIGVITHEGSNDGLNGITLLDLGDPAHPAVITRFTSGLSSGVHNLWVEGDHVYVVVDGIGSGLRILDISNRASPAVVASYYAGTSFLHDVYVRDGLAFLSHWNAGLVILDVGNGVAGGSPSAPVEVSRIAGIGGQTHNAWY